MAYIGKQPVVGNFVKLDAITTSATTTFNLLNGGVAYFPQTANNCLVSLNGILQAPTDSYTISGSTIIFSSALTTSDVIDFIIVLGDVLNIGTPSDNTVSLAKLTATGTKDATTFLRGDNTFVVAGITEADQWRLTADITADVDPISSNLERVDSTGFGYLGTGMSVSSGTWTFPSTGIYLIRAIGDFTAQVGDNVLINIRVTVNNSTYTTVAFVAGGEDSGLASNGSCEFLFDVTDTANCKVRFSASSITAGSIIEGDTTTNRTSFTFIRLGNT
jgi:hypothetical protein